MTKFECFIEHGFNSADIEANDEESAKQQFVELIRDNLESEHIIVNNLGIEQ